MPSTFPTTNDTFSVPSSPSTTTLSSAGDSTRNHIQHHRDLGDAIVAIESNVALLNHDHSGGSGSRATQQLAQANTHQSADTDTAKAALHHTIGTSANQAAAGNHTHVFDPRARVHTTRKDGTYESALSTSSWTNLSKWLDFTPTQDCYPFFLITVGLYYAGSINTSGAASVGFTSQWSFRWTIATSTALTTYVVDNIYLGVSASVIGYNGFRTYNEPTFQYACPTLLSGGTAYRASLWAKQDPAANGSMGFNHFEVSAIESVVTQDAQQTS